MFEKLKHIDWTYNARVSILEKYLNKFIKNISVIPTCYSFYIKYSI